MNFNLTLPIFKWDIYSTSKSSPTRGRKFKNVKGGQTGRHEGATTVQGGQEVEHKEGGEEGMQSVCGKVGLKHSQNKRRLSLSISIYISLKIIASFVHWCRNNFYRIFLKSFTMIVPLRSIYTQAKIKKKNVSC